MITKIALKNFKGFSVYDVDLSRINLLVGGNNSGKTTIFHALQLIFWCIEQTADVTETAATFRKTQVPQVGALPYFSQRDLFFRQQTQGAHRPVKIELSIGTDSTPSLSFSIYRAFSRNLMIDGANQRLTRRQFDLLLNMKPVYIAGAVGITVQEEYLRPLSQQRLISEGRQNQVLRNLVYRLSQTDQWNAFTGIISPLFDLQSMKVPFDVSRDEWLTATYVEDSLEFDLLSAGSGFLQTINLLCFLFLNESRTVLLDEPDSHMHDDLQRLVFDALNRLSQERRLQLIIATHSPTFVDVAGLESVLLIDRKQSKPLVAQSVETLIPKLTDQGLALPPNKVLETLRVRRALFVEGFEADYEAFILALGEVYVPGFAARTRGLAVFATGGAEQKWPFAAITCFEELIGASLIYVYLSDRDFFTDDELCERQERGTREHKNIVHLERRHRESYLLEPRVISRLLTARWRSHSPEAAPNELSEASLKAFILERARQQTEEVQADLIANHEPSLRGPAEHRKDGLHRLLEYFKTSYKEPLERGEIPVKLLNAKKILRELRSDIADRHHISFTDIDLCKAFERNEISADIQSLLTRLIEMFPEPHIFQEHGSRRRQSNAETATPERIAMGGSKKPPAKPRRKGQVRRRSRTP